MDQLVKKEGYSEDMPDSEDLTEGLTDRELADQGVLEVIWMWRSDSASDFEESPTEVEFLEFEQDAAERGLQQQEEGLGLDPSMRFVSESRQIVRRLFEAGYVTIDRRQAASKSDRRSTRRRRKGPFEQEFGDLF